MDPKHIPRASPQDIARQKRLLGVALVAGAGVLYWVITRSDETKTTVNRVRHFGKCFHMLSGLG